MSVLCMSSYIHTHLPVLAGGFNPPEEQSWDHSPTTASPLVLLLRNSTNQGLGEKLPKLFQGHEKLMAFPRELSSPDSNVELVNLSW